jgi:radical SAM protein with 4Fe4S-binding SPASM domain
MRFDRGLKAPGGLPLVAQILVADTCNHACQHCYQVHGHKGEMSTAEIEAILDELARLGVLIVSISGGEATLRPDLPEILRAARRRAFGIILQTNGYTVGGPLIDALEEVGVWRVRISVYSDVAAEHDAVTCVPGSLAKTMETIRRLRGRGIPVTMVVPLTRCCSATAERIEALAASLGCDLEISSGMTAREDGSAAPLEIAPAPPQLDAYFRAERARGGSLPAPQEKLAETPCAACSSSITVHADGSVRPCTHIPLELGRAGAGGAGPAAIAALPRDEAFRFLAGITWRDLHGCRDCALLSWCSRCHGSAAFEAGDLLGPQPSACGRAVARYEADVGPAERLPALDPEAARRDPGVGPFELVGGRALRPARDARTPADEALARRFPWVRPSRSHIRALAGLIPAERLSRRGGAAGGAGLPGDSGGCLRQDEPPAPIVYASRER